MDTLERLGPSERQRFLDGWARRSLPCLFLLIAATLHLRAEAQDVYWPQDFAYGEWCGQGHPAVPDEAPPPIDEIDAACRTHDFAYDHQGPWGNAAADAELADTVIDVLIRGTTWNRHPDGQRSSRVELSDRQFAVGSAIASWMSGQKFITIYSDVVNGKVRSVLKLGPSSARAVVAIPSRLSNRLVTALSREVSAATGLPLNEVDLVQSSTDLSVEFIVSVSDAMDWTIDELGDSAQAIVRKIGDVTGFWTSPSGKSGRR